MTIKEVGVDLEPRRTGSVAADPGVGAEGVTDPGVERTGAQIVWECLTRQGVEIVFGYPGGAILPTYDVAAMEEINRRKAAKLYTAIDESPFYANPLSNLGLTFNALS